jgi:hypothetical protein
MGMLKKYLLELICLCSEHSFGQDAVEWAILNGRIKLTYHLDQDLRLIMGEPGRPETGAYSDIIEAYQAQVQQNAVALVESYGPLLDEINRAAA